MSLSKRGLFSWLIVLTLLGVWGYSRVSPAFAGRCRSFYAVYVKPARDAGLVLLKREARSAEEEVVHPIGSRFDRRGQTGEDVYNQTLSHETSVPAAPVDDALSPGTRIANGHAFEKHRREFGFSSRGEMAAHVDRVIDSTGPPNVKRLRRGRVAYWDDASASVVIVDPNTADGGTTFKPGRGRAYFDNLR